MKYKMFHVMFLYVLAEEGKAKAVAFDEIGRAQTRKREELQLQRSGYCFLISFVHTVVFHPIFLLLSNLSS